MPDIVEWSTPIGDRTDPQLEFNNRSGGVALNGAEQILSPLSSRWRYVISVPANNKARVRALRTVKSKLKGRLNLLRLRVCDQYRINFRDIGLVPTPTGTPHSDETLFDDDVGYSIGMPPAPVVADGAAGTTVVVIDAAIYAAAMTAGVFFSINDRLYQVDDWELNDAETEITMQISPPLREAIVVGDEVNFDATCLWQLAADEEGSLNLQIGRFGTVTMSLVEPIGRIGV